MLENKMNGMQQQPQLELYPIYGLWHVPFWQRGWFIIIVLIMALFLFGVCIYLIIKRYRAKKIALAPWQIALNGLQDLKVEGLLLPEISERYYVRLTGLLKEYISDQFGVDVRSLTDDQICTYIDTKIPYTDYKEGLKRIFTAGVFIKFANQSAIEKQMVDDWQHARKFVDVSKPLK
jgi:hypothetical protein